MFLGTHTSSLDAKGRMGVPARFRAALRGDADVVVVRPSSLMGVDCLECCDLQTMTEAMGAIGALSPFGEERHVLGFDVFSEAYELKFDTGGRVKMPQDLVAHAGLGKNIQCVGSGDRFYVFTDDALKAAREKAKATLPAAQKAIGGQS